MLHIHVDRDGDFFNEPTVKSPRHYAVSDRLDPIAIVSYQQLLFSFLQCRPTLVQIRHLCQFDLDPDELGTFLFAMDHKPVREVKSESVIVRIFNDGFKQVVASQSRSPRKRAPCKPPCTPYTTRKDKLELLDGDKA